ncbi:hypothetical protein JCGZ_01341 [Jatropha curcas]|uniref:Amino acid transporter transmembrane domain-containing protein n=1 Tax=Jatropha curcas TaxID=180498 RepID=A0A067L8R5_JATCU|nr:hypothetical protein JCGZ_01341 [Jatropha curcas]
MDGNNDDARPRKIYDEEHLAVETPETAHQISSDSWFQVAFVLTTGVNSAYVLGYAGTIMVPLGKKAYSLIWGLQYINLFMINIGYIILAGEALKAVFVLYSDDNEMKLPYFIAIAGIVCALFAITTPHLSALRIWLGVSTVLTLIYIIVAIDLSINNGLKAPPRDYSTPGTPTAKIFTSIGAAANLVFAYNTGMLPEIQATIKQPVVSNMMKALYIQFTFGSLLLFAVTWIGYWAYGNSPSTYLLSSVSGPVWVKTLANIAAFFQSVIALHVVHTITDAF